MISIQLCSRSLSTHLHHLYSLPTGPFSSFRIFLSSLSQAVTKKSAQNAHRENPVLLKYLINTLDFPKPKALVISGRLSWVRNVEKPKLTVHFFKSIGFTDAQIQSAVCSCPQILTADVEKILKPKIQLLQELGITGSDLGKLVSTRPIMLARSLDKILKPSIEVLSEVLIKGTDNRDWFRVLRRCDWVMCSPHLRLVPNISYLQSVGIVGSQLSSLLKSRPHLFVMSGSKLKKLVSELMDIGFSTDSRMLVHGLHTLSCLSQESISRKLLLFQNSGFSKSECMVMFRRSPGLFRTSEEKIRLGLEFFLETAKWKKSTLVQHPTLLMLSMKERVIPRYQVFQLIKLKKLMKKDPNLYNLMYLNEDRFLEKYVSRFTENAEELLKAYKGHRLDLGEEHWGIYEADGSPKYKIDFSLQDRDEYPTQAKGIVSMPHRWCMFDGDKNNMDLAKKNYNSACEEADCTRLEERASCGELSDESKISYAFNAYFQKNIVVLMVYLHYFE